MNYFPSTSLAKLKYRMINRASRRPMVEVDRTSFKQKCDVVEYARMVQHLKKTFGGDADQKKKKPVNKTMIKKINQASIMKQGEQSKLRMKVVEKPA